MFNYKKLQLIKESEVLWVEVKVTKKMRTASAGKKCRESAEQICCALNGSTISRAITKTNSKNKKHRTHKNGGATGKKLAIWYNHTQSILCW